MQSAQIPDGTTLFISQMSNGLSFTLSLRDVGQGERETHVWKTSYPLLDLVYPHWVPKVPANTPIDFFSYAVDHAEKLFGWKLRTPGKQFKIPEKSFGDGISRVVCYSTGGSDISTWGWDTNFAIRKNRQDIKLHDLLLQRLEDFVDPVIFVSLDFGGIEIIECEPRFVGNFKRWEYRISKVVFESQQQFIEHLLSKRFLPFMSDHIPETQIFNLLMNHVYWKQATTSSKVSKDVWRAILTALLSEIAPYTSLQKNKKGHIFVTGEIPSYLGDDARVQLALIDGLGVSGAWTVTIDEFALFIPYLIAEREKGTLREFYGTTSRLWIIPQVKKGRDVLDIQVSDTKYTAFSGNLYNFGINVKNNDIEYAIGSEKTSFSPPYDMTVKECVVDMRSWPVVYGPNPISNSGKVDIWIERLRKNISGTKQ